jgi:uncharacterized membrane protein YhaH (DUF805 family)
MDWYLKVLKNYIGFGGRARRKEYWMFILVNIILTGVLSIIDKMLGWQRAGGRHSDDHLWRADLLTVVGGAVSSIARHRPLGMVAVIAADPRDRLAGDPGLQLPERHSRQ